MRSRNADGAAAIAGVADGQNACGNHGCRAARRAARGVFGVPGVERSAIELGLCGGRHAELRRGGLAKDVESSRLVARHQGGILRGDGIFEEGTAIAGHGAGHAHAQIFEHKRQTPQRRGIRRLLARIAAHGRDLLGMVACLFVILDDHGIEPGQSFNASNGGFKRLQRRHVTLANLGRHGNGIGRCSGLHHSLGAGLRRWQGHCCGCNGCPHEKFSAIRICRVVLHVFVSVDIFWMTCLTANP